MRNRRASIINASGDFNIDRKFRLIYFQMSFSLCLIKQAAAKHFKTRYYLFMLQISLGLHKHEASLHSDSISGFSTNVRDGERIVEICIVYWRSC